MCSLIGEKLKPFVIGKYANPKALKGANRENMPVRYAGQKNAWMTGSLFIEWLLWFDTEVARNNKNRKVILFLDNASVHTFACEEISEELKHTKIMFLPKNTTSQTQPLAGIGQNVKVV